MASLLEARELLAEGVFQGKLFGVHGQNFLVGFHWMKNKKESEKKEEGKKGKKVEEGKERRKIEQILQGGEETKSGWLQINESP